MLPKVVKYGGFQSYSQKPYPHLKPGKEQKREHSKYATSNLAITLSQSLVISPFLSCERGR